MSCIITFDDGRAPLRLFRLSKKRYLAKLIELEKDYMLEDQGCRQGIWYYRATRKPDAVKSA